MAKILLVDGDIIAYQTLKSHHLKYHDVIWAESVKDADTIIDIQGQDIDIVILEFLFKYNNCIVFLDRLLSLGLDLEIIILTGEAPEDFQEETLALGVYDYFEKPLIFGDKTGRAGRAFQIRIENCHKRLVRKRKQERSRRILYEIFSEVANCHSLADKLKVILKRIHDLNEKIEHATVRRKEGNALIYLDHYDHYGDDLKEKDIPLDKDSISREVLEKGVYKICNDVRKEPNFFETWTKTRTLFSLPLKDDTSTFGILNLSSREPDAFSDSDMETLGVLADHTALTIRNHLLLEDRTQDIETVYELSSKITASGDLQDILNRVLEAALIHTGADLGHIALSELVNNEWFLKISGLKYSGQCSLNIGDRWPIGKGFTGRVLESGKGYNITDVSQNEHYWEIDPETKSELVIPLKNSEKIMGIINLESHNLNHFTLRHERLVKALADMTSIALKSLDYRYDVSDETVYNVLSQRNLEEAFDIILARALETMRCQVGMIGIFDDNDGLIHIRAQRGITSHVRPIRVGEGIIGISYEKAQLINVPDVNHSPNYLSPHDISENTKEWPDIQSTLTVPLKIKESTFGVLDVQSHRLNDFDAWDEFLLSRFAAIAAAAIEYANLYGALTDTIEKMFVQAESESELVKGILELVVKALMKKGGKTIGGFLKYDSSQQSLTFEHHINLDINEPITIGIHQGVCGAVAAEAIEEQAWAYKIIDDIKIYDDDFLPYGHGEMRSEICCAVWSPASDNSPAELYGIINIENSTVKAFDDRDAALLRTFCNSAATAIRNFRRSREAESLQRILSMEKSYSIVGKALGNAVHNIRQKTSWIKMDAGSIQKKIDDLENVKKKAGDIEATANDILNFIRTAFSQIAVEKEEIIDIRDVINEILDMPDVKMGIEIKVPNADTMPPLFKCNSFFLLTALLSIIENALEVLQDRDDPLITITTKVENSIINIKIADNGPGIPEEIKGRIFEPRFTTRETSGGSGLGLTLCREIIHYYKGRVDFTSSDQGTTFIIRLPLYREIQ